MAKLVLDRCVTKCPSTMTRKVTWCTLEMDENNSQTTKPTHKMNINGENSGKASYFLPIMSKVDSNPTFINYCSCKDFNYHRLYNYEFIADTFFDKEGESRYNFRLNHPLLLMVITVISFNR